MEKNQENKLTSYHLTEEKLNYYNSIWNLLPAFSTTKTAFSNKIIAIHAANLIHQAINTGIAIDKKVLKVLLADVVAPVAGNIKAFASQTNNNELFNAVNYSHAELVKVRDELLGDICQIIHNHATANLVALGPYGVTALILTGVQNAITAYTSKVPAPGSAKVTKKTATLNLRNLFKDTDTILKKQLDQQMVQFKTTEPNFFNDYTAAREIINLGVTHTTIRVLVKDENGVGVPGVMVSLILNGLAVYHTLSGVDGKVVISKIKPGTYDLKVEKTGFVTKTQAGILFKAGKDVKRTISLSAGSSPALITIVREMDLGATVAAPVNIAGINGTAGTRVLVTISIGTGRVYGAPTNISLPGAVFADVTFATPLDKASDEFQTLVGLSPANPVLMVQNLGAVPAHITFTFTNLEP